MERVAKQGIICSLISHLEANSFLQLVSEKCSSVIGTGNRVSSTQGSVPFLPELAEQLTSLCLDWPPFLFPTNRDKNLFIQIGSDVLLLLRILMCAALIHLPRRRKSRTWVQFSGCASQRAVPGPAALQSPESWLEMQIQSLPHHTPNLLNQKLGVQPSGPWV